MLADHIISTLTDIVGQDHLSLTDADRQLHEKDQSEHPAQRPDLVIWPATSAEVSQIVQVANENHIAITGWGAGSSLEGNTIPLKGGIVINFGRMDNIVAVHANDFQVTVQPGMLYKDMNKVLAPHGLFFPPDPGANASIGGMVANNAAGSRTVKYGATRDNVLALEVVLASGEIIRTGARSVKQSAGYDLTHLFTGSEGTLGLITEATLKLHPLPEFFSAVKAGFSTAEEAAEAVFGIIGSGLNPAALELLDRETIRIIREAEPIDLADGPHLFMEFNGASEVALAEELTLVEEICQESGCILFGAGVGLDARNQMWEARHKLLEIMLRAHPGQNYKITDVAVPISNYPELVTYTSDKLQEFGLAGSLVGHAGDGNLHTVIFYPPDDTAQAEKAHTFNDVIVSRALELEGTCTGEHGVGIGKKKYLIHEHGEAAIGVMRMLKETLDPNGIMNPGKVI